MNAKDMILISKASMYGIKAAIYLSKQVQGSYIPISNISKEINVPFHYLTKILQEMRKGNIIRSSKGIKGGVFLTKAPEDITLYEIIYAIENKNSFNKTNSEYFLEDVALDTSLQSIVANIQNYIKVILNNKTLDKLIN
ncbi:MAG: Rrf2 family transcriptional regulator [FCB group bacterium]|jgi:Rrf2 family protein